MSEFSGLRKELKNYLPKEQIEQVEQAFLLAKEGHAEQTRSSGEPYITHPVAVAMILAQMRLDAATITAAILHDVLEDTGISKQALTEKFGEEVAELVDGVTKLTKINFETRAEAQAENFRKMMMAMARDLRVIIIKLSDRLHNMRTLTHLDPEKRRRIAKETLEIYAPITNRLGMHNFLQELEDLSFAALYPLRYKALHDSIKRARGNRKDVVNVIEKSLHQCLQKSQLPKLKLWGREKHLYSIYRKMRAKHARFSEVMDVYAFRIITDSIDMCYRVLGVVHNIYKPVPERFKDFIAIPKANGYQSLHTTLFGPYGVPIEVQIRTEEMDRLAENGIAAHWLYKLDDKTLFKTQARAYEWIKEVLEIQQTTGSSLEFIENVKVDLFPDEIYVFTPKGEIIKLPRSATPVDFAYAVHTEVGNACIAAKASHRLVSLSTPLKSGQTIEIITAPGARPNPGWLNFVVTGKARSGIRHYLKSQQRVESVELGRHLLEKAMQGTEFNLKKLENKKYHSLLQELNCETVEDLLEHLGLGNHMPQLVMQRLLNLNDEQTQQLQDTKQEPLTIKGAQGLVISFAKCCYPIPGDSIEGVMAAGRGIIVHEVSCQHLSPLQKHSEKCIPLRWEDTIQGEFEVALRIDLLDRRGALAALTVAITDADSNIRNIRIDNQQEGSNVDYVVVTVQDRKHLARLLRRVRLIPDVIRIIRYRN